MILLKIIPRTCTCIVHIMHCYCPCDDLCILQVFAVGHDNRATGSTKMNIQSSRSHALLCVAVHGKCKTTGVETFGTLPYMYMYEQ